MNRRRPATKLAHAVAIALLFVAAPAQADRAESLFKRGRQAFELGRFQRSLELLRKALPKASTPALVAEIQMYLGINHSVLGDRRAAARAFASALRHDPLKELDPNEYKPTIVETFRQIRSQLRGYLEVASTPPGASVLVDGTEVGETPYRGSVRIGRHQVEVRSPNTDEVLFRRSALVAPERTTRVASRPPVVRSKRTTPTTDASLTDERPRRGRRLWTWIAAGGAVLTGALGIGFGLAAKSDYDEYKTTADPTRFDALADRIPTRATVANAMFAATGVLAVTSAVLFFFEPRWLGGAAAAPSLGPGTMGMTLLRRF